MRLVIRELTKLVDQKAVLDEASYSFYHGKVYGLVAPKGGGKTALLNCISGEASYEGGTIMLEYDWKEVKPGYENMGMVYENPILPDYLTGYEFVKYYLDVHKDKLAEGKSIDYYLKAAGINDNNRNQLIRDYSSELRSRLQIMCIIIAQPEIILMDEPLSPKKTNKLQEMKNILDAIKKDSIIIYASNSEHVVKELCDEYVLLKDGVLYGCNEHTMREALDVREEEQDA